MSKPTLFVCQSCHATHDRPPDHPADGIRLLEQIHTQCPKFSHAHPVVIQTVGCLWTCDHACAAALSEAHKPTYLFTKLPADENTAAALLQFSHLYSSSSTGDSPWKQFPPVLQQASIAKIPAVE